MSSFNEDRKILRALAQQYAGIAALDAQKVNEKNWRAVYSRKPNKPMMTIDQICWHEIMAVDEEMKLLCQDPFARQLERSLRETIYRWKYFPCDMVVKPYFGIQKITSDTGYGVSTVNQDETGHEGAQTHLYEDGIPDEAALEKLHAPVVTYEKEATEKAKAAAQEYFGDIVPVQLEGKAIGVQLWDRIVFWRGAEVVLYDLIDRPEFLHALMDKLVDCEMKLIDQYEEQNLFQAEGSYCHCLETYCDELPAPGFDPNHVRAKDCWVCGMAQIFSEVSPAMHDEFEIEHMKPVYDRFGLVNYGCCEPLHNKIDIIRKMPNVRAISTSPWANVDVAADKMGSDFVMARKPNPAFVAFEGMDEEPIRKETRATLEACKRNNTPVIFVLKDITTIRNQPERLKIWHDAVKDEIERF